LITTLLLVLSLNSARAETLSLKDAVERAVTHNPSVADARLGVASAGRGVASAWGKHLPRLSVDGNYTRREVPFPFVPAESPIIPPHFSDEFASYSFALTLPLYQGGQVVNGVALARAREEIQRQGSLSVQDEIIANTVNTYNKILQLRRLREASHSSLEALNKQYENAQQLFQVGRTARIDLLKVEVQLANERQRLIVLDTGIATATAALRALMGDGATDSLGTVSLTDTLTSADVRLELAAGIDVAHRQRPEYLRAVGAIREAEINRKLAFGKLLPLVNAVGGYLDQYGFAPWYKEGNWYAGVSMSMPLFDRSLYADVSRQGIETERARERLRAVDNQLALEIHTALNSIDESRARINAAEEAVAQAGEAYRIEQERYRTGAGAVVDLLLAQSADVTAAANYSQALYNFNSAVVAYRRSTGTLEEYLK
jgi:outer membrane protein TolC